MGKLNYGSNMSEPFWSHDDAFVGTPKSHFYSIARTANPYLEMEVDRYYADFQYRENSR